MQEKVNLIPLKLNVNELDIDRLKPAPNHLNNLQTILQTIPIDLKKLSDAIDNAVENAVFNGLNSNVEWLQNKI